MTLRFDSTKLGKAERTPQGGLRVPASVTRTGIFEYRRADGSIQRELRHPDEVFQPESLATLQDATLTKGHPGKVTSQDYQRLSIGHVRDPQRRDGEGVSYVDTTAIVQDAKAVKGVEDGSLIELSCGYNCDLVMTSGEYNGEKYDAIQTNIRYNHVAIGPQNWGRAGKSVALRLDSMGDMVLADKEDETMEFEIIDGIQFKVGSSEHIQALKKSASDAARRADSEKVRADAADAKLTEETARADKAEGERDSLKTQREDSTSRAAINAAVQERISLERRAAEILGTSFKFDSLSDREVRVAAIKKTNPKFDDKKADGKPHSDDYILGHFENCGIRKDSRSQVVEDVIRAKHSDPNGKRADGKKTPAELKADAKARAAEEWKKPLSLTK